MEVQLKVLVGGSAGKAVKVSGPKFFIGRSEECHLRPHSDLIGRHHCAIIVEGDYVAVHDFGSKNGTYVNGERVSSQRELKAGDRLKVGPLEFEVCLDLLAQPKRPAVSNIKEAAERASGSSTGSKVGQSLNEAELEEWLGKGVVSGSDTSELRDPSASTTDTVSASSLTDTGNIEPIPPPKPGDEKPKPSGGSDEAAAEMLRKLRRFR